MRSATCFGACSLVLVVCGLAGLAEAQTAPVSATGTGTVTGHVVCADTERPARFAGVMLFGIPKEVTLNQAEPNPNDMAAMKATFKTSMNANLVQGQTGLDGSFALSDVPPGDYYAFSSVAGYVQPAAVVQAAYAAGADPKKPLPGVAVVHVAADHTSDVELSSERGAAVIGRVVWDDGAPVTRTMVLAERTGKENKLPPQFAMLAGMSAVNGLMQMSDDQGHYRIAGLLPGEYVIRANVSTGAQIAVVGGAFQIGSMMAATPLVVYAPDKVHKSSATTVKLTEGEEREQEITIRLGSMHTVSGRIRSAEDGHGVNSGVVKLTDTSDKDFVRSAGVDATGNFTVTLVPPGTYALTVTDAEDTRPSTKKATGLIRMETPETVRSYEEGKAAVVVTDSDVSGQNVDVRPSAEIKKKPDFGELLKE